ncbi:MAG: hypothetical protein HYY64_13950 [Candidatus Rokubacteria bacterium]|nr:hypothetical protein [Candidatus Rokubacteria bacterium]
MKRAIQVACLVALGLLLSPAEAGHELPVYPSYYPHEIHVEVMDPASAGKRLLDARIHAYIGAEAALARAAPDTVSYVESLGSYLVLTFHPAFLKRNDREARCAVAAGVGRAAADRPGGLVFHPYPITPYHADYLHHVDLSEASEHKRRSPAPELRVRAVGRLAERLFASPEGRKADWDATVEEISAADLVISHAVASNGWLGPPWVKEGWFHAFVLLGGTLTDASVKETVESMARRLRRAEYGAPEERLNLERDLVTLLRSGCERVVLGYTVKREAFNSEFSAGIENIAYDSETGLNSGLFIRTVKLKDFPWNGWLRIGINTPPSAAWNPVGGFTDPAGRLIWHAVGDPALLPAPYNDGWVLNRIVDVRREPRR